MRRVLQHLIDLDQIEVNLFRGRSPKDGGQVLVAAGRTVDGRTELAPTSSRAPADFLNLMLERA
ncbi:MAG: hypothetical protein FJ108_04260 [Deltaproteobacteria bacterium]|nr:hypothetical protein [Deltaproteobacteria bacterium]